MSQEMVKEQKLIDDHLRDVFSYRYKLMYFETFAGKTPNTTSVEVAFIPVGYSKPFWFKNSYPNELLAELPSNQSVADFILDSVAAAIRNATAS
jgi:hypothetical protein